MVHTRIWRSAEKRGHFLALQIAWHGHCLLFILVVCGTVFSAATAYHRFVRSPSFGRLSCFQESSRFSLTVSLLFPTSPVAPLGHSTFCSVVICCYYCFYFACLSFEVVNDFYNFEFGIVFLAPSLVHMRWLAVDWFVLVRFRECCCCCCTRLPLIWNGAFSEMHCIQIRNRSKERARALALFRLLPYTMQSVSFGQPDKEIKLVL